MSLYLPCCQAIAPVTFTLQCFSPVCAPLSVNALRVPPRPCCPLNSVSHGCSISFSNVRTLASCRSCMSFHYSRCSPNSTRHSCIKICFSSIRALTSYRSCMSLHHPRCPINRVRHSCCTIFFYSVLALLSFDSSMSLHHQRCPPNSARHSCCEIFFFRVRAFASCCLFKSCASEQQDSALVSAIVSGSPQKLTRSASLLCWVESAGPVMLGGVAVAY